MREDGFYPVKNEKGKWEVVRWSGYYWFRTGSTMGLPNNWFEEIGPKIEMPR